jgi:hypothetical protein
LTRQIRTEINIDVKDGNGTGDVPQEVDEPTSSRGVDESGVVEKGTKIKSNDASNDSFALGEYSKVLFDDF